MAWLPSSDDIPIASDPIIDNAANRNGHVEIAAYDLSCLALKADQALLFFQSIKGKEMIAKGVFLGKDVPYLAQAYLFALSLSLKQRFLPKIDFYEGEAIACWEPVYMGKDKDRLTSLINSFPSICRCITLSRKQNTPPRVSAKEALHRGIAMFLNIFILSRNPNRGKRIKKRSFDTMHDQWLHRMESGDPFFTGDAVEADRLSKQVDDWKNSLTDALSAPFRLCFRLEEPEGIDEEKERIHLPSGPWKVRFLLQAHDDPSLLIGLKEVWNPKGGKKKVLNHKGFNARQFALTSLGFA